jgi:hypothetical protein
MSLPRRLHLLELAEKSDALIFEDSERELMPGRDIDKARPLMRRLSNSMPSSSTGAGMTWAPSLRRILRT